MTSPVLSPEQERETLRLIALEAAKQHFSESLRFTVIEEAQRGGAVRFERWPYLVERARAWEGRQNEVILKARQLGFTWLAAAYALHVARRENARVLVISKGELESFAFLDRVRFINAHFPPELRMVATTDNAGELRFEGGGTIVALPSTKGAGRGFTAALVIVDEAAFHPWAADNYRAYRPTIADGGQLIVMSTANGATGFFADQWKANRNAVFVPWYERPGRTAEWLEEERQSYIGLPDEFRAEYPATPQEAFVALSGLVFPQFDGERHVFDWEPPDHEAPMAWEDCLYRYAAYDLGGGDPTVIGLYGVYRRPGDVERVHEYGPQFYKKNGAPNVEEMAAHLVEWHSRAPFVSVECDPRDAVIEATLRDVYGLPCRTANNKRGEGLGIVAQFLENGWWTIDSRNTDAIHEFYGYRWASRVDTNSRDRYATSTPADHHADAMDARRYALTAVFYDLLAYADEAAIAYRGILI